MGAGFSVPLSPEHVLELRRRLCVRDPWASSDLLAWFLVPLTVWLERSNPRADPHLCAEAAEQALLDLIKRPESYDPSRSSLCVYLSMAAQGDLRNLLRREERHHRLRVRWELVENGPDAGKYLGRQDDPALPLRLAEEARPTFAGVAWTEEEARVLALLCSGERRHASFAVALSVVDRPLTEQVRTVKRVKDRLKKRLERAGGDHERTA